jgi:hypothetical protein
VAVAVVVVVAVKRHSLHHDHHQFYSLGFEERCFHFWFCQDRAQTVEDVFHEFHFFAIRWVLFAVLLEFS